MATDQLFYIRGTLKNADGTALASATVEAVRLQSAAVAASLLDGSETTADKFTATTNASGVFTITVTHALTATCPLSYRVNLPDKRYFILPFGSTDASQTIDVGTLLCENSPATTDINITALVERNLRQSYMVTKVVAFTENASATTHTGSVVLPAGAWLHNIQVLNQALWTATGAVTMKVGDTADDDGYFVGIDLKATDLLVGEVLDTTPSTSWGGKEGAYLVAASGRRGPTATNFAKYYAAGSTVSGIITVASPATTAGRTFMAVTYSVGDTIAATAA